MSIISRFLVYFGAAFLGIGVIIMSFLRKRISSRSKRVKRRKLLERRKKRGR